MSVEPKFASGTARLEASDAKTTVEPSDEICARQLRPLDCPPVESTLTRTVVPSCMSCRNSSGKPFVALGTRLEAMRVKATNRPSAEIDGASEYPFAWTPVELTLTRIVWPVWRSRSKMSGWEFVSPRTSVDAALKNATY